MKICMFTNTYLPHVGGVARSVAFFTEDLRTAGHEVLVVAPTFPGWETHDASKTDIYRVPAIQEFNGSDFSVRVPLPFVIDEKIDDFQPDIIHSHHPYLLGDAALRAARRRHLPLVFTHHTLHEEYAHYISRNPGKMKRFAAFLSTNYANLCDRVIAPSRSIAHLIRERDVTVPIAEVPTGVDVDFFSNGDGHAFRKEYGISDQSFVIGHLGRLAPEKNLIYLANALARAAKQHPDMSILIAGDGPSSRDIENIFSKAGVGERLTMTGQVTGQDLADAYQAMKLFAFASKSETQGMVLTEAMAAGVPVVALDAAGAREVVRDGHNGRLLETDTPEERFAQAVLQAADDRKTVKLWMEAARRTAERFSRRQSAGTLVDVYHETIHARQQKDDSRTENLDGWDKFLLACRAEWDLVVEKTESLIQTINEDKDVIGLNELD